MMHEKAEPSRHDDTLESPLVSGEAAATSDKQRRNPSQNISAKRIAVQLRRRDALVLRQQGFTYQRIAEQLGYSSASEARKQIKQAFHGVVFAEATELRQLEIARLEALLESVWPAALDGKLGAINAALKIITRIDATAGLDQPSAPPPSRKEKPIITLGGS